MLSDCIFWKDKARLEDLVLLNKKKSLILQEKNPFSIINYILRGETSWH